MRRRKIIAGIGAALLCLFVFVLILRSSRRISEGFYSYEGYISNVEYPMDEESIDHAGDVFRALYERYLKGTDTKVYLSVVPDKNCFTADGGKAEKMDYDAFYERLRQNCDYMSYIPIAQLLELDDYYRTDMHWRQEKLLPVAEALAGGMGAKLSDTWEEVDSGVDFEGMYAAKLPDKAQPERFYYLNSSFLDGVRVYDYQNDRETAVYDLEKLSSSDPYDAFMGGDLSLVTIENPNAPDGRELVIFRDSFASCLAPLLSEAYSRITLVDIRFLMSSYVGNFVQFKDQDVLFLYSTSVINHSQMFK